MADPITYGVIMGVLESMYAGQQATAEAEKKAAEQAQQTRETAVSGFMDSVKDSRIALGFVNSMAVNPTNLALFEGLDPYQQATVVNYATGDLAMPAYDTAVLNNVKDADSARNFILDNIGMDRLQPSSRSIVFSLANVGLGPTEKSIMTGAPSDRQERIAYFSSYTDMYKDGTPFGKILRNHIDGLTNIKDAPEYKSISVSDINSIIGNTKDSEGQTIGDRAGALGEIDAMIAYVEPFAYGGTFETYEFEKASGVPILEDEMGETVPTPMEGNPEAVRDLITLRMMKKAYAEATDDDPSTTPDFSSLLELVVDRLDSMKDKTDGPRRKATAENQLESLKTLGFDPEKATPDQVALFNQVEGYAREIEDVAKGTVMFGSGDNQRAYDDPFKNPLNTLRQIDRDPNLPKFYESLDQNGKFEFETMVRQLITADEQATRVKTERPTGATEQRRPSNFIELLPNMYENLEFFGNFLHDELSFPKPGETANGVRTVSLEQTDMNGAALGPDFFRFAPGTGGVLQAGPALKAIAQAQNKTPQQLLLTDSVIFNSIDFGAANPQLTLDAANAYAQSGIFLNNTDRDLKRSQYNMLAYPVVSRGIMDRDSQLDAIAINMDGTLPKRYKSEYGVRGITAEQYNGFLQHALGRPIDLEAIGKSMTNSRDFLSTARTVQAYLEAMPPGSRAFDELSAFFLNVFAVDDSFIKQVGRGVANTVAEFTGFDINSEALFRVDDMYVEDGQDASDVRVNIIEQADKFMKTEFLKNNARLKASLVTLAYNYAKTMDPSGRISERDFAAALEAVSGGTFDNRETQLSVVNALITNAQDNVTLHSRLFDTASSVRAGTRYYQLSQSQVKNIRALRHFYALKDVTRGMEKVDVHSRLAARLGDGYLTNPSWAASYVVDDRHAAQKFGQSIARSAGVTTLKMRAARDKTVHPMGAETPVFIYKDSGQVLTGAEIRSLTALGGGV